MVRGITAYRGIQNKFQSTLKSNQSKKAVGNEVKKASDSLPKLLVLPGVAAGTYSIININPVKCGKGCDDFDCDWNVYTFG